MPRGRKGRYKKSPDLAEPPKAADIDCNNALCRYSIIWPPYFNVWSTLTLSRPCQGSQAPGPWTGNVPSTTIPTIASSQVSVTKSLMSHIMYATPVTSNVIHWDARHSHPEERSLYIVWSSSGQSCLYSELHCSCPLGELEPLHKVETSRSRFIMCGAVLLSAVRIVSFELFVHLRELDPLH